MDINITKSRHVGVGFAIKQPKWSDDKPQRGSAGHVAVEIDTRGAAPTYHVSLAGRLLVSLNRDDAQALGIALIAESDRWA